MLGLLAFIGVFLFIFSYFLFAPFYFEINSLSGLYGIRFHRLISARLKFFDNSLFLEIKCFSWYKKINLFKVNNTSIKKPVKQKNENDMWLNISWKKIRAILMSFKFNKCIISFDSGDMKMNGVLFPVFYLLKSFSRKNIGINFYGENKIIIEIENSLARIAWAYLKA